MALKLYPIGIQTFEEIINRKLLYIDKTEYVYRMTHGGGKHFFLSLLPNYLEGMFAQNGDVALSCTLFAVTKSVSHWQGRGGEEACM